MWNFENGTFEYYLQWWFRNSHVSIVGVFCWVFQGGHLPRSSPCAQTLFLSHKKVKSLLYTILDHFVFICTSYLLFLSFFPCKLQNQHLGDDPENATRCSAQGYTVGRAELLLGCPACPGVEHRPPFLHSRSHHSYQLFFVSYRRLLRLLLVNH